MKFVPTPACLLLTLAIGLPATAADDPAVPGSDPVRLTLFIEADGTGSVSVTPLDEVDDGSLGTPIDVKSPPGVTAYQIDEGPLAGNVRFVHKFRDRRDLDRMFGEVRTGTVTSDGPTVRTRPDRRPQRPWPDR